MSATWKTPRSSNQATALLSGEKAKQTSSIGGTARPGDALAAAAEKERGVPHHAGADDLLEARVGVQVRLAHEGQPAVEPGLGQQRLGLIGLLLEQHVHPPAIREGPKLPPGLGGEHARAHQRSTPEAHGFGPARTNADGKTAWPGESGQPAPRRSGCRLVRGADAGSRTPFVLVSYLESRPLQIASWKG
jgi:hypothetical protein